MMGLLAPVLDVLFPPRCLICREDAPANLQGHHLCAECTRNICEDRFDYCPKCAGNAGAFADLDTGCPKCHKEKFQYQRVVRLGQYDGPLRDAILEIKNSSGEGLAEVLGLMYAHARREVFQTLKLDALVPVPLHWRKRWQRGYNQSDALAWGLGKGLGIPVCSGLRRRKYQADQTSVSAAARRENPKGAFEMVKWANLKGRHVGVVDDVLTTGSTCSEAALTLKNAGVAQVTAVVLAHRTGTLMGV